ncbi:MAG: hypothetical protein EPO26_10760 [Chloroflexota bacterium]|nr:MAG: hypothetical protein EPO26_10760 [Chloroflexota bacterium]
MLYEGSPRILGGDLVYKMWYTGGWGSASINYAESFDGVVWTKYAGNPVIAGHSRSYVLRVDDTYYGYAANGPNSQIDLYTSRDGVSWILDTAAALPRGPVPGWDDGAVANISVLNEGPGVWKMLYDALGTGSGWQIGLATSSDGRVWTRYATNPVLSAGLTGGRGGPWLRKDGSRYFAWVHGSPPGGLPTEFQRYTSTDLVNWSASPSGATLGRETVDEGSATTVGQVADATLIEVAGQTRLYYAASTDGADPNAGQHIKLATAPFSLSALQSTRENALSTRWTPRGFVSLSSDGAMLIPSGSTSLGSPTFVNSFRAGQYTLSFTATILGGARRFAVVAAYIDDTRWASFITRDGAIDYQEAVPGGGRSVLLANTSSVNLAQHDWRILRRPTTVELWIDGMKIGATQTLSSTFLAQTTIGFGATATQIAIRSVLVS